MPARPTRRTFVSSLLSLCGIATALGRKPGVVKSVAPAEVSVVQGPSPIVSTVSPDFYCATFVYDQYARHSETSLEREKRGEVTQ